MTKFIHTTQHAIIGESGAAAATLAPGDRVPFNEDAASHKEIARGIEAGDEAFAHLSIEDVDLDDEKKEQEKQQAALEKAQEQAEKDAAKEQDKADKAEVKEQEEADKAAQPRARKTRG